VTLFINIYAILNSNIGISFQTSSIHHSTIFLCLQFYHSIVTNNNLKV